MEKLFKFGVSLFILFAVPWSEAQVYRSGQGGPPSYSPQSSPPSYSPQSSPPTYSQPSYGGGEMQSYGGSSGGGSGYGDTSGGGYGGDSGPPQSGGGYGGGYGGDTGPPPYGGPPGPGGFPPPPFGYGPLWGNPWFGLGNGLEVVVIIVVGAILIVIVFVVIIDFIKWMGNLAFDSKELWIGNKPPHKPSKPFKDSDESSRQMNWDIISNVLMTVLDAVDKYEKHQSNKPSAKTIQNKPSTNTIIQNQNKPAAKTIIQKMK